MKTLITGSAGRIGRAIYARLGSDRQVIGLDIAPSPTTDIVSSIEDIGKVRAALSGIEAVVHTAALHAPHVGHFADGVFEAVNVAATEQLARLAVEAGIKVFIFTSTTALYGSASTPPGRAGWVDETTEPAPRTVYHRSKLKAEALLQAFAHGSGLPVTVIRMSRCFPEPAPLMAAYRLHRGADARDVADAHAKALDLQLAGFSCFVVSGATPFLPEDAVELLANAPDVVMRRCPELALAFKQRGWELPQSIDRVYSSQRAMQQLNWQPKYGFGDVLAQLDRRSAEVLPA